MFGRNKTISANASAVVTGAGSGIGRAFAEELARRNGAVVCADINLGTAQETADRIAVSYTHLTLPTNREV